LPFERVVLQAKQGNRSFAWHVSPEVAKRMAAGLRKRGWTVAIRPETKEPETGSPNDE
jgi:hypothetical protein